MCDFPGAIGTVVFDDNDFKFEGTGSRLHYCFSLMVLRMCVTMGRLSFSL